MSSHAVVLVRLAVVPEGQEEAALLKARHRARRVEAQPNRRRREREERLAKDEARINAQSAEHQVQRLLLLQLPHGRAGAPC